MKTSYTYRTDNPDTFLSIYMPCGELTEAEERYIGTALNIIVDKVNQRVEKYKSTLHHKIVERWFS